MALLDQFEVVPFVLSALSYYSSLMLTEYPCSQDEHQMKQAAKLECQVQPLDNYAFIDCQQSGIVHLVLLVRGYFQEYLLVNLEAII